MRKIAELQKDEKIGEAIGVLQQINAKEYPEHEKRITEKMAELKKLHSERTLF
jgi:hypothetical protein